MWLTTIQEFVNTLRNVLTEHVQGQQDKRLRRIKLFLRKQATISYLVQTIANTDAMQFCGDTMIVVSGCIQLHCVWWCGLYNSFSEASQCSYFIPTHFEIVGIWMCEHMWGRNSRRHSSTSRAALQATAWRSFTFHPKGFLSSKNSFGSPRYSTSVGNTFEVVLRVVPLHQHVRCFVALVAWNPFMDFYPTELLVGCVGGLWSKRSCLSCA